MNTYDEKNEDKKVKKSQRNKMKRQMGGFTCCPSKENHQLMGLSQIENETRKGRIDFDT